MTLAPVAGNASRLMRADDVCAAAWRRYVAPSGMPAIGDKYGAVEAQAAPSAARDA